MIELPGKGVGILPLNDSDYYNPNSTVKIIRPDAHKDRCDNGVVKYVGKHTSGEIKPGDHVIFSGYAGKLIIIDGEKIIVMPEDFIDARIVNVNTELPGLFFRDRQGEYHQANYDIAMEFIRQGIEEADWYKRVEIRVPRPKNKEYDKGQLSWSK